MEYTKTTATGFNVLINDKTVQVGGSNWNYKLPVDKATEVRKLCNRGDYSTAVHKTISSYYDYCHAVGNSC